jgi:hypothetical protein
MQTTVSSRRRDVVVAALTLAGAALLVAGTLVPVNGGGRAGYPYAIFDTSVQRELQLFAAEPLCAAVLSAVAAVLLFRRWPAFASGALVAFGIQTGVLFLAYFGGAVYGNPLYNSFRAGSVIGLAGAALIVAAGAAGFWKTVARRRAAPRGETAG